MYNCVSILVLQSSRCGCFALFAHLVSRDCFVALPRHAMGLSAVCDFGKILEFISVSYWFETLGKLQLPENENNF